MAKKKTGKKAAPKSGRTQKGQFEKGKSGNPTGRPKETPERQAIRDYARTYSKEAVDVLVEIMRARPVFNEEGRIIEGAPHQTRKAAADSVLDRGEGKPAQALTGPDGGPIRAAVTWDQLITMAGEGEEE